MVPSTLTRFIVTCGLVFHVTCPEIDVTFLLNKRPFLDSQKGRATETRCELRDEGVVSAFLVAQWRICW